MCFSSVKFVVLLIEMLWWFVLNGVYGLGDISFSVLKLNSMLLYRVFMLLIMVVLISLSWINCLVLVNILVLDEYVVDMVRYGFFSFSVVVMNVYSECGVWIVGCSRLLGRLLLVLSW